MIQKILDTITFESAITNIGYSIIATLIVRLFDYVLKSNSKAKNTSTKWKLINFGELIGCLGSVVAIVGFILLYIIGAGDKLLTIDWLAKLFLICYGSFLLLHIISTLINTIKGQGNFRENMEGISLMILLPSIFILLLFRVKMIAELQSGLSIQEVDEANKSLLVYWMLLMKAIFISFGFLITSKLINHILNRIKNE